MVTLNIPNVHYSVKSNEFGEVYANTMDAMSAPYTSNYVTDNANSSYYYRIWDSKKTTCSQVYGPFTNSTTNDTIKPTTDQILKSIIQTRSTEKVVMIVEVCTGSNKFEKELTYSQTFGVLLDDFSFIAIDRNKFKSHRNNDGSSSIEFLVTYPKSYSSMELLSFDKCTLNRVDTSLQYSYDKVQDNQYKVSVDIGTDVLAADTAGSVFIQFTDNISTNIFMTRIGKQGQEDIYIYNQLGSATLTDADGNTLQDEDGNTLTIGTTAIKCVEFIEGEYNGYNFKNGGRVLANKFIEGKNTIQIGDKIIIGEFIEA